MQILMVFFSDDADVTKVNLGDAGGTCITNIRCQIDAPAHGAVTEVDREYYAQIPGITPGEVNWYLEKLKISRGINNWLDAYLVSRIRHAMGCLLQRYFEPEGGWVLAGMKARRNVETTS